LTLDDEKMLFSESFIPDSQTRSAAKPPINPVKK
jgi:hypothetical protein